MKHFKWQAATGLALLLLSALLYTVHYAVFKDAPYILSYIITDLAFLPIEVLLVTMIIHKLLTVRESRSRMEKLNMVIGVFYSEMGTSLLALFSSYDPDADRIRDELVLTQNETEKEFSGISRRLMGYEFSVDIERVDLKGLRDGLIGKRDFLIRLLENPTLLEHESFTDLLWAVFHLVEELKQRGDMTGLPESDLHHLRGDIKRAYAALAFQWLAYMKHLKESYPYLFSLALRTNPFDRSASPVVK